MSLDFKFDIEELPDAKSFILYDLTGNYSETNVTGWGGNNIEKEDIVGCFIDFVDLNNEKNIQPTLQLDLLNSPISFWEFGVLIPFSTNNVSIPDGSYSVIISLMDNSETKFVFMKDFGFYMIIKDSTMKELLGYNQFLPKRTKEIFWEKGRLLDNLWYASEYDQIDAFDQNLIQLKKLS